MSAVLPNKTTITTTPYYSAARKNSRGHRKNLSGLTQESMDRGEDENCC